MARVPIGIIGDFNPGYHTHHATNASLGHAANALGRDVESTWIPTRSLADPRAVDALAAYAGLWAAPGGPYRSMAGMLAGIRFARTRSRPFVGT